MNIEIPFELGYVQLVNQDIVEISKIEVDIYSDKTTILYVGSNISSSNYPVSQVTKEEYKAWIKQKELDKIKSFQNILDIFNEVFNESDFDYKIHENTVDFIIRFESFIIQNNKGENHLIKDLFVKLEYNIPNKRFTSLYGIRKTLNYSEHKANYGQSHLNGHINWSSFCLGDGDISKFWDSIQMSSNDTLEKDLRGFLYSLYPYLMWENLDATPWRYIQNIKQDQRILQDNTVPLTPELIKEILSKNDISENILLDESTFQVQINEGIQYLSTVSQNIPEVYTCYYDDYLTPFYGFNNQIQSSEVNIHDSYPINFKDQVFKLKILPDESPLDLSTYNKFLSPKNRTLVISYIKDNFIKTIKQSL